MSTYDPSIVASLAHDPAALRAYMDAVNGSGVQVVQDEPKKATHKRSSARSAIPAKPVRTKGTTKGKGKREPKAIPTEWVVDPAWAGVEASPRMLSAALYWGIPVATCNKLKSDKLALATAIGNKRGIPVVTK